MHAMHVRTPAHRKTRAGKSFFGEDYCVRVCRRARVRAYVCVMHGTHFVKSRSTSSMRRAVCLCFQRIEITKCKDPQGVRPLPGYLLIIIIAIIFHREGGGDGQPVGTAAAAQLGTCENGELCELEL